MTWSHIELGGANYGSNPGVDKTYLPLFYIAGENQFNILFNTVDNLIQEKGKTGCLFINDLHKADIDYAIEKLKQFIARKHPDANIKIIPLPGDYFKLKLPFVNSIHLKNPEYQFFTELDKKSNQNRLQYFADHADEGLTFVTHYKRPFLHRLEKFGVGYKIIDEHFEPYRHVDGEKITRFGNVIAFCLKSLNTLEKEQSHDFATRYTYRPLIRHATKDIYGRNYLPAFFSPNHVDPDFVPENRPFQAKL